MMVQIRPRMMDGFPSTISATWMFISLICRQRSPGQRERASHWTSPSREYACMIHAHRSVFQECQGMFYVDSALECIRSFIPRLKIQAHAFLRSRKYIFFKKQNQTNPSVLVPFRNLTSCCPERTSNRSRRTWPFLMSVNKSDTTEGGVCCKWKQGR